MKKIVSLLLVLCMLSTLSTGAFAANPNSPALSDMVPKAYWSYDALSAALDAGLMVTDGNRIRPYDAITRAEMATMVLRAMGLDDSSGRDLTPFEADVGSFRDVHKDSRYYADIAMAYKLKLLTGSGAVMAPDGTMSREQAFIVLCKLLNLDITSVNTSVLNRFKDRDKISSWAKPYLAAMTAAGYISGSGGILDPRGTLSRQQCAQLLYNLFKHNYIGSQKSANALSGQSVTGNLVVTADKITLANLKVNGDVIIGDGVGNGEVTLDHVTISGRLIVRGGGRNSIYLKSTTAGSVIVEKLSDGGIRLHADDGSAVAYVEIPDGKDTVFIECNVGNLSLSGDNLDVVVNGSVRNLSLSGDNASISGSGSVGKVSLEEGVNKVSLTTPNTQVVNHSGSDVTVLGQNGTANTVSSGTTITANTGIVPRDSDSTYRTVAFHSNGGGDINPITVADGNTLGDLPLPAKDNMIFIGWFTDDVTFANGVSPDTKVSSNLDLYACYMESAPIQETDEQTTASVNDVAADYQITVLSSNSAMTADDVKADIKLDTITEDPEEFGDISVTGSSGTYTVAATSGYSPGCSYALTLNNNALTFKDESSSIRTYNITVKMPDPVLNLKLNSSVKSIPVGEISNITQNNTTVASIFAPLYTVDGAPIDNIYGTFDYSGGLELAIGDNLAIYEGTPPEQRMPTEDYTEQKISYVTVTGIDGSTISYGKTDAKEVLFTPDVLPVNETDDQDGDANNNSITIAISKMTYTGDDFAGMGLNSSTTVDPGDFMAFYTGSMDTAVPTIYAKISSVSTIGNYYVINYYIVTESDLMSCMDMSSSHELNQDQLSEAVDLSETEDEIKQQVQESGFADAAANYFVSLAQADKDTRDQVCEELGIKNFSVSKVPNSVASLAFSEPQIDIVPHISSNLEHFSGDGLHCDVTVTCVVDLGDDAKLTVSGTFVEEYKVTLGISSKTIWKYKWGWLPYISDYQVSANVDLYNYTYLSLNMDLAKDEVSTPLKIKDSIKDLKNLKDNKQANKEVQKFLDLYKQMLSRDHSYFDLFNVQICDISGAIDPFNILAYGMKVNFDVSLDADVALATEFGYEKGTRYNFTLNVFAGSATSTQTDLEDEQYNFSVYAMGTLGIKAGIKLEISVGLFDTRLDSVGISAEVGAYWQIWGFLYYELEHKNKKTTTESGGGCYMELGIYLTIALNAQVGDGLASSDMKLYDQSWPLWSAGSQYYTYDFNYVLTDNNDNIILKGDHSFYNIPSSVFKMAQMDFKTGDTSEHEYSSKNYTYTIKDDPYHAFDVSKTGIITVTPPDKSDIAAASIDVTWNSAPLAFTSAPISRTFSLIWDNLASNYVIVFAANGGIPVSSIRGAYRSAITLPTPTRAGYTFDGWYTDNDTFQHAFTENRMPAANYILYAKWTAGKADYTVRHYQQTADGSSFILADTEKLSGTTDSDVTPAVNSYTGFISPVEKTVAKAGDGKTIVNYLYLRNSYTLTFNPNNGSDDIIRTLKYGVEITAPSLHRAGYNLTGWDTAIAATMPAHDLDYTAQWSINTYTITCDLDGGSVETDNPGSYTVQSAAITLTNPTKAGYIFAGWTGTGLSAASTAVTIQAGSTGNRYYTATWRSSDKTPYTVYHYREDLSGKYTILEAEAMTGMTGADTAANAKLYTGFTAGPVVKKTIAADGSTIVEIDYTRNSYTLTFDANGGTGGSATQVKYGAAISAPDVTKQGYTFAGWSPAVDNTMPAQNTTYTAEWTENSQAAYTVEHYRQNVDDNDYTLAKTEDLNGATGATATATAKSYTGFTYDGNIPGTVGSGTIAADGSLVLKLYYTRNSYTLTFDANGGTGGSAAQVKYGAAITAPDVTKQGYTFAGWSPALAGTMPAQDATYTAVWTASGSTAYTVEHYLQNILDNDYTLAGTENLSGATGTQATAAEKSYTGFTYDSNAEGTVASGTIADDGSLVLKLYYTRNSYTLTFDDNGGSGGSEAQVKYGAAITAPDVTKQGYTFAGWDSEVADTMPAEDATYTARWTENAYPSGTGTLADPYLIASFANLKWVSENNTANAGFSGKYFKQTADINMSPTTSETWIPIGNVTNKFSGTYNGNGYSVENLYINTATIRQGLFGVIGDTGTVTDLGVTSVDITCSAHNNTTGALTGALVGTLYGSVLRCYSTGTVSGDGNTGGLIGYSYGGTIKDCYSRCTVIGNGESAEASWDQVGGLLGKLALTEGKTGSVSNCYATGNVTAGNHDDVGGLAGEIDTDQEVYSCFATGTVTGNTYVGGITGVLQGPMCNSYTTSGTFKGSAGGTITGGNTGVALSWFMVILNFTTPEDWDAAHQWDFVNTWAIDPSINDGLPYLKKSKLGR